MWRWGWVCGGRGGVTVNMTKIYHMHYETFKELIKTFFLKKEDVFQVLRLIQCSVLTVADVSLLLNQWLNSPVTGNN